VTAVSWHGRAAHALENEAVRLLVVPSLGARVVSLIDRRTDREWLVQGEPPATDGSVEEWDSDAAVFGGAEAFGWDECLPTVAPCADPLDPDGPPLRDHGDQWGRPAEVDASDGQLLATWISPRWPYVLRRTLRLAGAGVAAAYELEVGGERDMPFLWSMHPLLALEAGASLVIDPPGRAALTHEVGLGIAAGSVPIEWPGPAGLDVVRGTEAAMAAKLYLDARPLATVAVRGVDGAELRFEWDRRVAPILGIWLDYGGWPAGQDRHQVALEPSTSPDDDLASAFNAGRAMVVRPGEPRRWTVRMEFLAGG
jgi:galactose mutarotase-like enzyme